MTMTRTLAPQVLRMQTLFYDYSGIDQHALEVMLALQRYQEPQHHAAVSTPEEDQAMQRAMCAACGNTPANQARGVSPCPSATLSHQQTAHRPTYCASSGLEGYRRVLSAKSLHDEQKAPANEGAHRHHVRAHRRVCLSEAAL